MTSIGTPTPESGSVAAEATRQAERAAASASVVVRAPRDTAEVRAVCDLLVEIWGRPGNPPVTPELLRAFGKTDNYVSGAFAGDRLVGACVGFHAGPPRRTLHSHIAGVAPGLVGRSVGFALKVHQRAWALARGVEAVEWTFDPLVSRNAYFNVVKLAARPMEYLTDFYGAMGDAINAGDQTDRLLVRWLLDAPVVAAACSGVPPEPPPRAGAPGVVRVAVPDDIESMRATDPVQARRWRARVRDELAPLLAAGGRIVGFERTAGYVVRTGGGS
ncbi:GNAT family N-acetyltransferase [Nocardioides sp. TF02-7]|uniref:GNAT family N-acetyltransferase n=1 Tax=Nocardioides sp. TF02-7 TaxID=2917724 RepID=UPI001F06367B|nr:GNAT family N-acetyltransferase [Nocardioides sp. TF02-7]UMG93223.1 GNAT family N-acetyltransferase [Nocardioides sp. TF02-7]